jgi:hypothetical protein
MPPPTLKPLAGRVFNTLFFYICMSFPATRFIVDVFGVDSPMVFTIPVVTPFFLVSLLLYFFHSTLRDFAKGNVLYPKPRPSICRLYEAALRTRVGKWYVVRNVSSSPPIELCFADQKYRKLSLYDFERKLAGRRNSGDDSQLEHLL